MRSLRGVLRAAAYLPGFTDGRARRRAVDEDAFTMVATAVERLGPLPSTAGPLPTVRLGDAHDVPLELLSGFTDRTLAEASGPGGAAPPLLERLAGPVLVVGCHLAPGGAAESIAPPGEAAFAVLVDELPASVRSLLPPDPATFALAELRSAAAAAASDLRDRWRGDWLADPSSGPSPLAVLAAPAPSTAHLSEGAYLPAATYRDGIASRWRFVGERCGVCSALSFPARGVCRRCGRGSALSPVELRREGLRTVAVTWIGPGGQPTEFDDQVAFTGAYGVALVELEEGARATVALADAPAGSFAIGTVVDSRLRRLYGIDGGWRYGRKAVPATPRR